MSETGEKIHILHFNDVYNIEHRRVEPVGGAARFKTLVEKHRHLNPLVLFSGDAFNPSTISTVMKGEQMIPVLNALGLDAAVYGNHDFDFGVDALEELAEKCNFPWLMSNVFDRDEGEAQPEPYPLGNGQIKLMLERNGKQIGLIGLVEEEWIATLSTVEYCEVSFEDFVEVGERLAAELRDEGADYVVALTHMRWPNDIRLAEECRGVDLILGGHDHDFHVKEVNGKWIIKSGTDFRHMSLITLTFGDDGNVDVQFEKIEVTMDVPEDPELKEIVSKYEDVVVKKLEEVIGEVSVELEGRFSYVRSRETNLGNFVCDIMLAAVHSDCALLNSGTLRSDTLHPPGEMRMKDLKSILPINDPVMVILCSGDTLIKALENGVSKHPHLEGRFLQVAGIRFAFDSRRSPGSRIDPRWVFVQDEPLELDREYRVCTKAYMARGKDGYTMFIDCPILVDEETGPCLENIVLNHFKSINILLGKTPTRTKHRQSLVSISKMITLARRLSAMPESTSSARESGESAETDNRTATRQQRSVSVFDNPRQTLRTLQRQEKVDLATVKVPLTNTSVYRSTICEWEKKSCEIAPKVEGRIREIKSDKELEDFLNELNAAASVVTKQMDLLTVTS